MKNALARLILVLTVVVSPIAIVRAQSGEAPLTNASVVKLVRAGFKEKTVIAIIRNRPNRFVLDPDRLIELKRVGVSENIILAMLAQNESFVITDDDWSGDFRMPGTKPDGSQSGSTDIFGSGSSSRSQSSGRGMGGGNEGETNTAGSATVRILRPPAEAGSGSLKLEKTPSLTNEAVIKLVEAGFTEGTIIKRIEDSPADFDLSPEKLEDLRRRRVTDAIILAMTAAMGDDSGAKAPGGPRTKGN